MNASLKTHFAWLGPLFFFALLTPWLSNWDLQLSTYFYDPQTGFNNYPHYQWLFKYGPWLGLATAFSSIPLFFLGDYSLSFKPWRRPALVLALTMLLGSGLIVHALLKDHWGRPRPRQIEQFGGTQTFRPYYIPNFDVHAEPAKSFPCGHCSTGFYFFALALVAKKMGKKKLYLFSLTLALGLGGLLSFVRIAQGGHFLSDTLASALIMWLTAYFLTNTLMKDKTT